ncbi:MAG: gfo/Idh/MocA family oxidoreductase, partial [Acidobacteria bacterium]
MGEATNRRDFLKRAAGKTAAVSLSLYGASTTKVLGANDRIRIGVIGTGRQGRDDMGHFMRHGCEVAAVCDVYGPNLQKGLEEAGGKAATYKDFRQVLDDKTIDAVIIGTPDHWHPLPAVEASKAGKDVYVEKPISVAIDEGKKMVEAARKYKRVVQVGTWQRSNAHFQKAVALVQDGFLGTVTLARTWNYGNMFPNGFGSPPDSAPPPELDWDMWLGPAPKVPFNPNRFGVAEDRWSTFRYFYDYANGWPGDWGVHLLDIVMWAMKAQGPSVITALGKKFCIHDNTDIPDTLWITYEFPGFVATYENRLSNNGEGHDYGIEFYGTEGTMFVDRGGFEVFPETVERGHKRYGVTPAMKMEEMDDGLSNHVANMLDCMKTRERPASDIELIHRTTSACILGNVALRTGQRLEWDVERQRLLKGGPE